MAELKTAKPVKGGLTMATDKLVDFDHVTDYISREAAIYVHKLQCAGCANQQDQDYSEHCKVCTIYNEIKCTEALPAADVVEVVRCKDCIHAPLPGDCGGGSNMEWPKIDGIYEDCTCPYFCDDSWYSARPDPEGFCEKGERREPNLDTTKGEGRDESSG